MFYLILFVASFLLTYVVKENAIKKSLVDIPNNRSSHTTPTPHGGGIAIAITWFIGISYLYNTGDINSSLYYALLVGIVISVVSYFDDLFELSAKLRLIVQTLVTLLGLYYLGGLEKIDLLIFSIDNQIYTTLFAFLLIIWFINLTNFIDGINGYVGSEFVFLSIAGFVLFNGAHFAVLGVAVLGFLFWNWNKAKIFMGDVGSTLLGYNIAIFTIYYTNQDPINLWIWITLFGLFWFDATITLIRRKMNGEKLSQAHKKHAYQRITQAGWSHYKATNYSIGLNIIIFALVYLLPNIAISFFIMVILLFLVMNFIDSKKKFK